MFCSNCGKEIDENVKFCSNCGAEIGTVTVKKENDNNAKKEKKKSKKKIKVVVGIIIVLIIGMIWFINKPHIYEIGEKAEVDKAFEFSLLDVKFVDEINTKDHHVAKDGNTFIVITYELEFKGKEARQIDCRNGNRNHFWLEYNDDYTITDSCDVSRPSYVLTEEKSWEYLEDYTFEPLGNVKRLKLQEFIEVPENILKEDGKSLVLIKDIYQPSGPKSYPTGYSEKVYYKLK